MDATRSTGQSPSMSRAPMLELLTLGGFVLSAGSFIAALAAYAERSRRESRTMALEPEWWPQFARDFEAYVHLAPREERRDDSHRA